MPTSILDGMTERPSPLGGYGIPINVIPEVLCKLLCGLVAAIRIPFDGLRRAADKCLPPLTLPSPPLSRCAGGGEGTSESAARPIRRSPAQVEVPNRPTSQLAEEPVHSSRRSPKPDSLTRTGPGIEGLSPSVARACSTHCAGLIDRPGIDALRRISRTA